jgi:hypothetical protein
MIRSRGRGHIGGSDPQGRATPGDRIPRKGHIVGSDPGGGAHMGLGFEFEYLGKFEFILETALGYE